MLRRLVPAVCLLAFFASELRAQNVWKDYVKNQPHYYTPQDPWVVGFVFRQQAGWGGFFYNCDRQEDKRYSPYIYWSMQPQKCKPKHPILGCIKQQVCEVKQRIRWGASCNPLADTEIPGSYVQPATESVTPDELAPPADDNVSSFNNRPKSFSLIDIGKVVNGESDSGNKRSDSLDRQSAADQSDMSFRMTRRAKPDQTEVQRR